MKTKTLIILVSLLLLIVGLTTIYIIKYNTTSLVSEEAPSTIPVPLRLDINRYLAHAGGQINGDKYTNSLEALNLNYSRGFRVFEIDIIKTSDNHLVCAHDWGAWERYTGFDGKTPVSLKEFLNHKIKGKYTPLSLEMLHNWFKDHPDAILFTDKIQDPIAVSSVFNSKKQLIMKFTSFSSIESAKSLGIEFVVNENILNSFKDDKVAKLKELGAKSILISRKSIEANKALLLEIKEAGIKTYASHVNFGKGKDELYVFENEMEYIYGFYADEWNFNE